MTNSVVMATRSTKKRRTSKKRAPKATTSKPKPAASRKRYSLEDQKQIVKHAKAHGYTAATATYGPAYMTIRAWAERQDVDMSGQRRGRKKGSKNTTTPSSSGQAVILSPKTLESLRKAEDLFNSVGFQTDSSTLLELAIANADFRIILENQVELIRARLQKKT
jgi:hypothetical protein